MTLSISKAFDLDPDLIYLNHAAVAPWPVRTAQAVIDFARENRRFGSKNYLIWLKKERELRQQLQSLINAPSIDDIALVKNTSEALSFVASGLDWQDGDNIVSSNEEFPSNRLPWQSLKHLGVEFREAPFHPGSAPEESLFDRVDQNTRLLTISSIQFASGIRVDLNRIGDFCKQRGILFCIDAIQSLGAVNFDVQACQADFVMADGHKWMLGPEGLGVFYTTAEARDKLQLTQFGWHMMADIHNYENKPWTVHPGSQRFECGSPNMLTIHALSASLSLLLEVGMADIESAVLTNAQYLCDTIRSYSNLQLLTENTQPCRSGIVLFKHRTVANQELYRHLSRNNVICAQRGPGIRFSPHFYNTADELRHAVELAAQLD